MLIDWGKLQPYRKTKSKSFEQLCYQIAFKEYSHLGIFTPIDDSGGGDGVEFYLTLPNGEEWGWQAKYYEGSVRLNEKGRKRAIIDSLKKTLTVHANLKKWLLCIPFNFTPDEQAWFETTLKSIIPANRNVEIIPPWNEDFIHLKLNEPRFNGLKQSFFNQLELNESWFRKSFENFYSLVANKFNESLYTPNTEFEYWYLNPILCNNGFVDRISYYPDKIKSLFTKSLSTLKDLEFSTTEWRTTFNNYRSKIAGFNTIVEELIPKLQQRYNSINPNYIHSDENERDRIEELSIIKNNSLDEARAFYKDEITSDQEEIKKKNQEQFSRLIKHENICKELIEEINYFLRDSAIPIKWRIGHFLGKAGTGKTNLCIALTKQYIHNGHPVIFIPAKKFNTSLPLTDQILSLLDIKSNYNFEEFLNCLDELGKLFNIRVPIILDGLNESHNDLGKLNERLALDIPQIENEISYRNNLVLLTTCWPSYKKAIWSNVSLEDDRFHSLYGFTDIDDKRNLIRTYFVHYKIQADLSFLSLNQFTKPLYLTIFCESTNPSRSNTKQVTLGNDSIYIIFEKFVDVCNAKIFERIKKIGKPPSAENRKIATKILDQISERLWLYPDKSFLIDDLFKMADPDGIPDYNKSVTKCLLDEEFLLAKDFGNEGEYVSVTYDLLVGYFIAKYLIETIPDFKEFINSDEILKLAGQEFQTLHPNADDILNSFCSLLPIKKQVFIHELIEKNPPDDKKDLWNLLLTKSIRATILLSPEYIPQKQIDFVTNLINHDSRNITLLLEISEDVFFVINHPFNFSFWALKIKALTMSERDIVWSEYLRKKDNSLNEQLIAEFEDLIFSITISNEQSDKVELVVDYLIWTLASTDKKFKQKASDCLYKYGKKTPENFFKHYFSFISINDPSIFEWLTIVTYNIILFKSKQDLNQNKDLFLEVGNFLKEKVLSPESKYSTFHFNILGYSLNIIETLRANFPEQFESFSIIEFQDNFLKLGFEWKESEDLNQNEYADGNSLIDYYFEKEKMPYLVLKGNEYNRTPEYNSVLAKLRWRAYQLGYEFEVFKKIDQNIARFKHYGENFASIERYADKYIDIAFYEYAGYLYLRQKLRTYSEHGYLRTFDLKYEPPTEKEIGSTSNNSRFVEINYLDKEVSIKNWVNNHSVPDIQEYLCRSSFQKNIGDWILINALVHQSDKGSERQIFFQIDSVLVKSKDFKSYLKLCTPKKKVGWANNSKLQITKIHELEIPDSDIIPRNEFIDWHYSTRSKTEKALSVFIPTIYLKGRVYLCRNIIEYLKLTSKSDTTDLFDEFGDLASFNYTCEIEYADQETFTYIRKDLIKRYLLENDLKMIWIVWGERDVYPKDGNWMNVVYREWADFYEAIPYNI